MKILKEGKVIPKKSPVAKCGRCGCEFSYDESEVRHYSLGWFGSCRYVRCPMSGCGNELVTSSRIQSHACKMPSTSP